MKYNVVIAVCCTLILCSLALCALSGCQLAKETEGSDAYEDKLIGVFITTKYLDLFDFEGYLNDNFNSLQSGEISMDRRNTQEYQGRIYAALLPGTHTNEEENTTIETHEYIFEGIDGIPYCVPTIRATEVENSYIATMSDPAISDGHTSIFCGDDEKSVSLDGTIYVTPSGSIHHYYFNPVYQSADGSVYLVSGEGFSFSTESLGEGAVYSQTLDAATTATENGTVITDTTSIKVSISVISAPERIVIVQMDNDNALIFQTEYKPGALPDVIALEPNTAYFIVETHKRDDMESPIISRDIYGKDTENIETFFVRADGFCVKHGTQIKCELKDIKIPD